MENKLLIKLVYWLMDKEIKKEGKGYSIEIKNGSRVVRNNFYVIFGS